MRVRDAGDAAAVCELESVIDPAVNARAIAIARTVNEAAIPGVRDVVSSYCAVAVYFDPLTTDRAAVVSTLSRAAMSVPQATGGRTHEVPVEYGGKSGPDLAAVAAFAGLTESAVIELHQAASYRVFMLGFLPGFPYMGPVDARIAAPRRPSPRLRVTAGSVGIAGLQTGIYPRESPGGWQIIGRTPVQLFDVDRTPPAVFAPGDIVRFVPASADVASTFPRSPEAAPRLAATRLPRRGGSRIYQASRHVTVIRAGLLTTIQDAGRWGYQSMGVAVAGPLDGFSHRLANHIVGNEPNAATLEITLVGPELRFEDDARLAISGADLQPTLDGSAVPLNRPVFAHAGGVLRFGTKRSGARSYVAFDGGVAVAPVLGSRATHVRSGLGGMEGRSLAAGDRIPLGAAAETAGTTRARPRDFRGGARLRVLPGPNDDRFPDAALEVLLRTRWTVTAQSDRMGYRLGGARIPTLPGEMISTPTFGGAIQVPPSGEPILLLADRQTTGGYPQLATVISADHDDAGQLAPGDWVEFAVCSQREALEALARRERMLDALR